MKRFKKMAKNIVIKYGAAIATCAFAFVVMAANTSCAFPYYEPKEPKGLDSFKSYNK